MPPLIELGKNHRPWACYGCCGLVLVLLLLFFAATAATKNGSTASKNSSIPHRALHLAVALLLLSWPPTAFFSFVAAHLLALACAAKGAGLPMHCLLMAQPLFSSLRCRSPSLAESSPILRAR